MAGVVIKGVQQLQRKLEQVQREAERAVRTAITEALRLVGARLGVYPAAPIGSRYRRTGQLGRFWLGSG